MSETYTYEADKNDLAVQTRIRKNERIAREAIDLIIKRTKAKRFKSTEQAQASYEDILNVIGIMCAEMIREGIEIAEMPEITAAIFRGHIDRALLLKDVKARDQ